MSSLATTMRQFTIKTRMRGAIIMVLVLLGIISLLAVWGGQRVLRINAEYAAHTVHELRTLGLVRDNLTQLKVLERQLVIEHDNPAGGSGSDDFKQWQAALKSTEARLQQMLQGEEDDDNPIARSALARLKTYAELSLPVLGNPNKAAYQSARGMDRLLTPAKQTLSGVQADVERIAQVVDREAENTHAELQKAINLTVVALGAALVTAAAVVTVLTLWNSHSITRPIEQAVALAQSIAGGDLTSRVDARGSDEVAALLLALQRMQASLRELVGQVHDSSQNIRNASVEVASGNTDLSHRTEQAAQALQQTSGSMEELTGTVQTSARSAREASELAASAATVARRGGQVVAQVVSTMEDINVSSKRIADIIGTIDGIAFQTNILALNAAVEAARAGEQGRGFAVVASEVRSLAQRSASAAQEIKNLIGASVDRVQAGSRLVADAGSTMDEIVASVQRVAQIIDAMAGAADDQSAGIGRVNGAISDLDHMTQQNAALVEQSAAAADSLKQQATRLSEVVGTFKLEPVLSAH